MYTHTVLGVRRLQSRARHNTTVFSGTKMVNYCIMSICVGAIPFRHRGINVFQTFSYHWSSNFVVVVAKLKSVASPALEGCCPYPPAGVDQRDNIQASLTPLLALSLHNYSWATLYSTSTTILISNYAKHPRALPSKKCFLKQHKNILHSLYICKYIFYLTNSLLK